jgi:hypothetical protein
MRKKNTPENPHRNIFPKNVSVTEDEFLILDRVVRHALDCMPLYIHEEQSLRSFLKKLNARGRA